MAIAFAMCILSTSGTVVRGANVESNVVGLLDMKAETSDKTLVKEYILGDPNKLLLTKVQIYKETTEAPVLSKRDIQHDSDGRTIIDLTPSTCTRQVCYIGSFQPPKLSDCNAIVEAQLYNSTGNLRAFPGTFVYVTAGTCAVVFQNPKANANYTLDYNWAKLGLNIQNIEKKCFQPSQESIGGICEIKSYLNYTLDNVGISVQRIVNDQP